MTDYKVVTCCNRFPTESYYVLPQYFQSLRGEQPIVLTEDFGGRWGGLASKPKWLYKAIKENVIDAKYMIFTDCWDLLFDVPPKQVFEGYMSLMDNSIYISSEKNCFPADLKERFEQVAKHKGVESPYIYLNSGFIIGETEAILTCLEDMDLPNLPDDHFDGEKNIHPNDQFEWMKIWDKQPVPIELDYMQIFSGTLHETTPDQLDFGGEHIMRKDTGTFPFTWHMNGNGKTSGCREYILKHLNLL